MKQKLIAEVKKMAAIALYLSIFLGGLTAYKRMLLAEVGISYFEYGYALVESLVLAKVVLIGDFLRLGERFRNKPLFAVTLHKAFSFSLLALVFSFLEHFIIGLLKGKGIEADFYGIISHSKGELTARTIIMFAAFVPLFAIWEANRALGKGKLFEIFFKRRPAQSPASTAAPTPAPEG